jgi:uncharacterized protein YyaL (SSP411 family)
MNKKQVMLWVAPAGLLLAIGAILMSQTSKDSQTTAETANASGKTGKRQRPSAADTHGHSAHLKDANGKWKWTNRLSKESSPYLLQHAHNPVDWYPWGPEAFEAARKSGKPIFLSIGYATCYWCHVMERQCFENPEIGAQMNRLFICIKVDREERPDVDEIYMTATQMMTRGGGWPMSVFMTPPGSEGKDDPGLKPFWTGTYIPPVPKYGRPSFPEVMDGIAKAWKEQKPAVINTGKRVAEAVSQTLSASEGAGKVGPEILATSASMLLRNYDKVNGGFGGAPKFPTPNNIQFLMSMYRSNPNKELWEAIAHTLDRMARGGMYDQVGGGFHRYSTDAKWLVPHFEKMLYDNAQLVEAYLDAHAIQPPKDDPDFYTRVVRETCDFVLREMIDPTGAIQSAQDAEVDELEGGNYLWLPDQVNKAVPDKDLAALTLKMYGLDLGTNFKDPHHDDAKPTNVLYLPDSLHEFAVAQKITLAQVVKARDKANKLMLAVRDTRNQPGTDDKVLVAWNGMMIAGLARAGHELKEQRYTDAAKRATDYILEHMRSEDGGLLRTMRAGKSKPKHGLLEDYAFFIHGLSELYRGTQDKKYLDAAVKLTADALKKFSPAKGGGYFDTLADQPDLFVRTRSKYDGAVPSGNSRMIFNLVKLYELTKDDQYIKRAKLDLESFSGALKRMGPNMAHMNDALLAGMEASPEIFAAAATLPDQIPGLPKEAEVLKIEVDKQTLDLSKGPATVRITLHIDKKYHINAPDPGVEGLIATSIRLENGKGLKIKAKFPKAITKKLELGDKPINLYEGSIIIEATISKTDQGLGQGKPVIILRYQACTESVCLLPKEIEIPVVISAVKK